MNEFGPQVRPSRKTLVLSLLGLAAFLALEALLLRHFIRADTRPPSWDQSTHLEIALDYREAIGAGRWGDFWFLAPKAGMPPFPPAYHLLIRGAYDSPDPAHAALGINWFYLAVLAVSLFGIAWRFLPDFRALAATLIFCAAPGVQDLLTTQLMDLSVVSWVTAAYWALLASEGFSSWAGSLAFAVVAAVGMLHKWTFFSYLLPAYIVWGRALGGKKSRLPALAALALSVALFSPWYWSHLAMLPTRLVQASSDFATPFWKDGAWATYLRTSCGALGPALWALGFIGMLMPQFPRRRENAWVLAYWVVFSYVFWTVVPNRQIRFLLPGLAPLGLSLVATWPRAISWSVAALQVAGAVNFFLGWVGPFEVPAPLMSLSFFQNRPPAREDWKVEEMLRRIEAERDPTRALTNVTLVANDEYMNAPTFHWYQRYLKLPHARMRGVNKRLCELSEFVLLKEGHLGPESVIPGLPEAAKQVRDPYGWFVKAYEENARWRLPDKSVAVLFRQRRGRRRPVERARLDYGEFQAGMARVRGMHLALGRWDPARSVWRKASVAIERAEVRELAVSDIAADAEGFSFVSLYEGDRNYDWNDLRLMRLDRLKVKRLRVEAADLKKFVENRVPGLALDSLTLNGTIKAAGRWKGKLVSLEAALDLDQAARRLRVRILSAGYMGTPIPAALFRPIKELNVSLDPNPETPFFIELPGLTIKNGRLTVP